MKDIKSVERDGDEFCQYMQELRKEVTADGTATGDKDTDQMINRPHFPGLLICNFE